MSSGTREPHTSAACAHQNMITHESGQKFSCMTRQSVSEAIPSHHPCSWQSPRCQPLQCPQECANGCRRDHGHPQPLLEVARELGRVSACRAIAFFRCTLAEVLGCILNSREVLARGSQTMRIGSMHCRQLRLLCATNPKVATHLVKFCCVHAHIACIRANFLSIALTHLRTS